jgi:MFS transporter, YNFM family, putative membrane transport protein
VTQTESGKTYLRRGTPAYRRVTLALVAAGFTTFALLYCVQPLMPVFSATFGVAPSVSSLSLSVTTAMLAVGMLIMGPISDAFGRKNVMAVSLFAVAALSILSAFTPNWTSLLVFRAFEGLALAGVPAIGMAYLAEEVHPQDLGSAMGLYIAGNAYGGLAGRVLVGIVLQFTHSARIALATVGVLGLLAVIVFYASLPPSRYFVAERGLSLPALKKAFANHLKDPGLAALFVIGFLLMGSFVTVYNYASYRLLAPPFGLNQAAASAVFLVYLVGGAASAYFGRLVGRFGRGIMFLSGLAFMLAGIFISIANTLLLFVAGLCLLTVGFFGAHAVASGWVSHRAVVARAQAASLYLFCYYLGSSTIGSFGGEFWSMAGWPGIAGLVTTLLSLAVLIGLYLRRMERREREEDF